jgi:predicted kinase
MNKKILYLMRGLPGSGKSTTAKHLAESICNGEACILSTDEYFTIGGVYEFRACYLRMAHAWNERRAEACVEKGISPIIIDNTNVCAWEAKPYVSMALEYGYDVQVLEPDTPWWKSRDIKEMAKRNTHGVSASQIKRMLERWDYNFNVYTIQSATVPKGVKTNDAEFVRKVYLVRGCPGSGRYRVAESIASSLYPGNFEWSKFLHPAEYFVCNDFMGSDKSLADQARAWNCQRFEDAIERGYISIFIIDLFPTNISMEKYIALSRNRGYSVEIVEPTDVSWTQRNYRMMAKLNCQGYNEFELEEMMKNWEELDHPIASLLE